MRELTYHVVDVFTDRAYAGNPLAVVLGAGDLPAEALQAMAKEFNLSETAFPMEDPAGEADYLLRIFTPHMELPFAGHPSVGTAWLLRALGRLGDGPAVQRCGAGLLPLHVTPSRVELTAAAPSVVGEVDAAPLLRAVGLSGTGPARICTTGLPFAFVEVAEDDVARAVPNSALLAELCHDGMTGVVVFAWSAGISHARVMASGAGVLEDAATGSAAAAFGVWLAAAGYVPADAETAYTVLQGAELGRPSRIEGTVVTRGGDAVECRIAGAAVPVATGLVRVPE